MVLGNLTRETDMQREKILTSDWIQVQYNYFTLTALKAVTLFFFFNL